MVRELSIIEYQNYLNNCQNVSFVASELMYKLFESNGQTIHILGLEVDGVIVGAGLFVTYPIKKIFKMAKCNQGPIINFASCNYLKSFIDGIRLFFKKRGYLFVELVPNFEVSVRDIDGNLEKPINQDLIINLEKCGAKHLGYNNDYINGVGRWFFVKDLGSDLINSYDNRHKRAVNYAKNIGVKVIDNNMNYLNAFVDLMEMTATRHQFNNRGYDYFDKLLKAFGSNTYFSVAILERKDYEEYLNNLELSLNNEIAKFANNEKKQGLLNELNRRLDDVLVKKSKLDFDFKNQSEIILSGAIFVFYQKEFTYLFGCSSDDYRHFKGSTLLQHHGMELALLLGINKYNFYGTMGSYCGVVDDGVYLFKKSFGGRVVEQPGNFRIVCHSLLTKIYSLFTKKY